MLSYRCSLLHTLWPDWIDPFCPAFPNEVANKMSVAKTKRFSLARLRNIKGEAVLWDVVAVALIVLAFSWICYRNVSQPGPYGDECWADPDKETLGGLFGSKRKITDQTC